MRRLPIFFLIDVSESMVGGPINEVSNGIKNMIAMLRQDPYAIETAYISIIVFAGRAKTLVPLTDLMSFYAPHLPIGGGTSLGAGLTHLMKEMDQRIVRNKTEIKGDWKPVIFLFTDGVPTDEVEPSILEWEANRKSKTNLVAISVGNNTDLTLLKRLTENVLILNDTDSESYKRFFKWITASISVQSQMIDSTGSDELKLSSLDGSLAKRAELVSDASHNFDDNYVVLNAKCQDKAAPYLIKYRLNTSMDWDELFTEDKAAHLWGKYVLTGSYPIIDEEEYLQLSSGEISSNVIKTTELVGAPSCPHCSNPPGIGLCQCGGLHCLRGVGQNRCPHCGNLGHYDINDFNLNRGQG